MILFFYKESVYSFVINTYSFIRLKSVDFKGKKLLMCKIRETRKRNDEYKLL